MDIIQGVFSLQLNPVIADAIPTMHRLLLRMESFHYQNDPKEFLTLEIQHTACILLKLDPGDLECNLGVSVSGFCWSRQLLEFKRSPG